MDIAASGYIWLSCYLVVRWAYYRGMKGTEEGKFQVSPCSQTKSVFRIGCITGTGNPKIAKWDSFSGDKRDLISATDPSYNHFRFPNSPIV